LVALRRVECALRLGRWRATEQGANLSPSCPNELVCTKHVDNTEHLFVIFISAVEVSRPDIVVVNTYHSWAGHFLVCIIT